MLTRSKTQKSDGPKIKSGLQSCIIVLKSCIDKPLNSQKRILLNLSAFIHFHNDRKTTPASFEGEKPQILQGYGRT